MHPLRKWGRRLPRPLRTTGVLGLYLLQVLRRVRGSQPRECSCCGYTGRFAMFGHPPRYDARCPNCGSTERHRLIALAMRRGGILRRGLPVLYFTPDPVLSEFLRREAGDFEAVGLKDPDRIDADDGAFGAIISSNVLEHVPDDQKALGELRRVLACDGCLVLTVPLVGGWDATYENAAVRSDEARFLHFGQRNHLRYYGRDVAQRVAAAGFEVQTFVASGEDSVRYSLIPGDHVFLARRTGRPEALGSAELSVEPKPAGPRRLRHAAQSVRRPLY